MKRPSLFSSLVGTLCAITVASSAAQAQYEAVPQSSRWHPNDLLSWSPSSDPFAPYNRGTVPLATRFTPPTAAQNAALHSLWNVNSNARPGEAKVQVVTTFNTIPAGSPNGWRTTNLYAPSMWQYTQNMMFWGSSDRDNRVIMCPTAHMIDAAHRNGVPIYGKIFFGWNSSPDNATLQRVRDLIQKNGNTFPVADKLVEAAIYFGFDGWFLNQENYQTNAADARNMRDFLVYFRNRAAAMGAPHLRISWYDAMSESGSRSFQNALTASNDGFLKSGATVTDAGNTLAAHEMFLNFWWYRNASNLSNSRTRAINIGVNPYDLYAGIWTENYRTLGNTPDENSNNNIAITWNYLFPPGQPHNTSVALYGAETPYVKGSSSPANVMTQDERYWSGPNGDPSNTVPASGSGTPNWFGLAHYIPANSPVTSLPFVTNFNVGQGTFYKIDGKNVMTGPWTNASVQDILPTWRWIVQSTGAKTVTPSLDFEDSYYGGSSLKVAGALEANLPQDVKLYQTRLPISANTNLRLVYKPSAATAARIQVGYAFEDAPAVMHYTSAAGASSADWTTADFPLGSHAGRSLALITLRFSSTSAVGSYSVNIGRIQIENGSAVVPSPPSGLVLEGKSRNPDEAFSTNLRLKWTPSPSPVLHYNVYHRKDSSSGSPRAWIGATPNHYFFVQDVRRFAGESNGFIEVEAVGPGLAVSPPSTTATPTFAFESAPNLLRSLTGGYPVTSPVRVIGSGTVENATRAFDNDPLTHAEPGGASGAWVGLDLGDGRATRVVAVQFVPRNNQAGRMTNGVFQGSNTADFSSGVVELAKIQTMPPLGTATTLMVTHATAFRYLRYLSPNDGYCNVAEVRFFGAGGTTPPITPPGVLLADNFNRSQNATVPGRTSTGNHLWRTAVYDVTTSGASQYGISSAGSLLLNGDGMHDPGVAWVDFDLDSKLQYSASFKFSFPGTIQQGASFLIIPRFNRVEIPGNAAFVLRTSGTPAAGTPATFSVYDYQGAPLIGGGQRHIPTGNLDLLTGSGPLLARASGQSAVVHNGVLAVDGNIATLFINGAKIGSINLPPTSGDSQPDFLAFGYSPSAASFRGLQVQMDDLTLSSDLPPSEGFAGFMEGISGLTQAQKSADADPDGDGISNLLEYALDGLDPARPDALPSIADRTITFNKRPSAVENGDITYVIETSTTLGAEPDPWKIATAAVDTPGSISLQLPSTGERIFARLKVIQSAED